MGWDEVAVRALGVAPHHDQVAVSQEELEPPAGCTAGATRLEDEAG